MAVGLVLSPLTIICADSRSSSTTVSTIDGSTTEQYQNEKLTMPSHTFTMEQIFLRLAAVFCVVALLLVMLCCQIVASWCSCLWINFERINMMSLMHFGFHMTTLSNSLVQRFSRHGRTRETQKLHDDLPPLYEVIAANRKNEFVKLSFDDKTEDELPPPAYTEVAL